MTPPPPSAAVLARALPNWKFDLSGGRPCLDYVNTYGSRSGLRPRDRLESYAHLLSWSLQAGTLSEEDLKGLLAAAESKPRRAAALLEQAKRLREALYGIFSAIAAEGSPARTDLRVFNDALVGDSGRSRIELAEDHLRLAWGGRTTALERPLWPVLQSASELLTGNDTALIRECGSESCAWLFLDRSRNRKRRWCNMKVCGNRAKAKRHYHRKRRTSA